MTTLEKIKAERPDLYKEIMKTGQVKGFTVLYDKAATEGYEEAFKIAYDESVEKERARIVSLMSWNQGSQNRHMDYIIAASVKAAIISGEGNEAVIAAVKRERARVFALTRWTETDADNKALGFIVDEAIASGKTVNVTNCIVQDMDCTSTGSHVVNGLLVTGTACTAFNLLNCRKVFPWRFSAADIRRA